MIEQFWRTVGMGPLPPQKGPSLWKAFPDISNITKALASTVEKQLNKTIDF